MASLKNIPVNTKMGDYVRKDIIGPIGTCDYSGFIFSKSDLVKQYEWRGNQLVWTGAMVGRPFVDEPNEQNRPPKIKGDPKTVTEARPFGIETPQGPEASGNSSASTLESINFTGNDSATTLSCFAGEDVSTISAEERIKMLGE